MCSHLKKEMAAFDGVHERGQQFHEVGVMTWPCSQKTTPLPHRSRPKFGHADTYPFCKARRFAFPPLPIQLRQGDFS